MGLIFSAIEGAGRVLVYAESLPGDDGIRHRLHLLELRDVVFLLGPGVRVQPLRETAENHRR